MKLNNMFRISIAASCLAIVGVTSAQVVNGSFEAPTATPNSLTLVSGADVPGWFLSGTGAVVDNGLNAGFGTTWNHTPDGQQYLYINANVAGGVTLSQNVNLTSGNHSLDFLQADFASGFLFPGGDLFAKIVRNSDSFVVASQEFVTPNFSPFISQSLAFNAPDAGTYSIVFTSVGGHAGIIDGVKLDAVPEPATLSLIGLGLAALARRRKN